MRVISPLGAGNGRGSICQCRTLLDHGGRTKETLGNYVPGGTNPDENIKTLTTYTPDGNVKTLTAVNPTTLDQTTEYAYGTTLTDSDIARSDLLVAEIYPDSADSTDKVSHKYNRQSEVKE